MPLSAFEDKATPPTPQTLAATLGRTHVHWARLQASLQQQHGPLVEEWNYAGKSFGWSFRLKEKKRVLVYMTPCRGHFLASFVLGEKACAAAHQAKLPAPMLKRIDAAPRYAEGRGVRFEVRTKADADGVETVAAIKAAN